MTDDTHSTTVSPDLIRSIERMANRLRRHSLESTSEAGSGHPTSCFSCAEMVSALFFRFLRFDLKAPRSPFNDRFVLSKGHAAPILWAAWAEAGAFPLEHLKTLRKIDSDLEGHPTPRCPLVEVATGSLGQGLSVAVGMALAARSQETGSRIYVLMGDGETAEGSVWEAAALASFYKLGNLVALVDVNRLGQSQATMYQHDLESYRRRFSAFGWNSLIVDGHDVEAVVSGLDSALTVPDQPTVIIAKTLKGKGVSFMEDVDGWHGKPAAKGEEMEKALAELPEAKELPVPLRLGAPNGKNASASRNPRRSAVLDPPQYAPGDAVATREAYGNALAKLGSLDSSIVVLDGDTKNSTYSNRFLKEYPDRFVECFIAEQNMVGTAVGFSAMGLTPFASTFACFLSRAYDQIRMAAVSQANMSLCGSHAGVSIGQDGPSQMGLEDLAMMRAIAGSSVLYPSDGVSAERMVSLAAATPGITYIRTSRPKTPILYSPEEAFPLGGSKVLRQSDQDRATIVAAGVTLHEALKAHAALEAEGIAVRIIDLYSVKPLDEKTLRQAVRETGCLITVEDHYPEGGIGDAVLASLAGAKGRFSKLAVKSLPRSGAPEELLDASGISAARICEAVKRLLT